MARKVEEDRVPSVLIRDVHVLAGRDLREGRQDVEIRDGRLHDVRPHRQGAPAQGILAFDGAGMHLLPGLIDLHVHHPLCRR
jgi:dihydroorotase-like cyclic amidohydrolase